MKKLTSYEISNASLWGAEILAVAILLRGTEHFWTIIMFLLIGAVCSMFIVAKLARRP
jgi:ABC-type Fe3+-siderophore transport system permease subunit